MDTSRSLASVWWLRGIRRHFVALAVTLAVFAQSAIAGAGALELRDNASLFTPGDRAQIEAVVGRYPFDVRVLTTTAYSDRAEFARYVGG